MKICKNCGNNLSSKEKFCGKCGSATKEETLSKEKKKFCQNCGQGIIADEKYCGKCGTELLKKETEVHNVPLEDSSPQVKKRFTVKGIIKGIAAVILGLCSLPLFVVAFDHLAYTVDTAYALMVLFFAYALLCIIYFMYRKQIKKKMLITVISIAILGTITFVSLIYDVKSSVDIYYRGTWVNSNTGETMVIGKKSIKVSWIRDRDEIKYWGKDGYSTTDARGRAKWVKDGNYIIFASSTADIRIKNEYGHKVAVRSNQGQIKYTSDGIGVYQYDDKGVFTK